MPDAAAVLGDLITGVAHVGFVVEDLEVAVSDTCRLYGIDPQSVHWQPPRGESAPTRFAFLSVGGLDFEFIEPVAAEFRQQLLAQPSGGAGINHLAWLVSDIARAVSLLDRIGVRPGYVTPGGVVRIGERQMVYLDPATTGGHLVELIQPADP